MRRAAKVDANQAEIVEGLRKAGCSVQILSRVGEGCPDLLVGYRYVNYLLEVKTEVGSPTPEQVKWYTSWKGHCEIVRSLEDALRIIRRIQ